MVSFGGSYIYFCAATCLTSCIFNGVLIYVVHKRRERVGFYSFFTYALVFIGEFYSFAFSAVQPIAFQVWFVSFMLVLLCVCASFVYRYGLLCSPLIVSMFEVPRRFVLTLQFLMALLTAWLLNANYVVFAESQAVRQILQDKFAAEYGVDLLHSYLLTVDINDKVLATRSTIGTSVTVVLMQSQIAIIVFCGLRIHRTIKQRTMSGKLKQMHGRALSMLISQALNPVLFLYVPSFIILFGMFMDTDFGDLPKVLAMVLAFFPIINPVIVVYFTEDYKRYLLSSGQVSTTQGSIVISKAHESRNIHIIGKSLHQ